jgi:hypothetical protein
VAYAGSGKKLASGAVYCPQRMYDDRLFYKKSLALPHHVEKDASAVQGILALAAYVHEEVVGFLSCFPRPATAHSGDSVVLSMFECTPWEDARVRMICSYLHDERLLLC